MHVRSLPLLFIFLSCLVSLDVQSHNLRVVAALTKPEKQDKPVLILVESTSHSAQIGTA